MVVQVSGRLPFTIALICTGNDSSVRNSILSTYTVAPCPSPEGVVGLVGVAGMVGVAMGVGFSTEAGGCVPGEQAARDKASIAKKPTAWVLRFIMRSLSSFLSKFQALR